MPPDRAALAARSVPRTSTIRREAAMKAIIELGTVSELTAGTYYAGTIIEGTKGQNPQGMWVYMKQRPGNQVDPAPGQ